MELPSEIDGSGIKKRVKNSYDYCTRILSTNNSLNSVDHDRYSTHGPDVCAQLPSQSRVVFRSHARCWKGDLRIELPRQPASRAAFQLTNEATVQSAELSIAVGKLRLIVTVVIAIDGQQSSMLAGFGRGWASAALAYCLLADGFRTIWTPPATPLPKASTNQTP